jgi:hypothetical protein
MKLLYDKISFENDQAGIYRIDCIASGKFYIGSSKYLYRRFKDHSSYLRRGVHCNSILQRTYNKYGPEAFTYSVLVVLPSNDRSFLYDMEQKFLDAYRPQLNIMNDVGTPVAPCKTVACYSIDGDLIEVLPSLSAATEKYGARPSGIRKAALEPWRVCAGVRWRYVEDEVPDLSIGRLGSILSVDPSLAKVTPISWRYSDYTIRQWDKSGTLIRTWDSIDDAVAYIGEGSTVGLREHLRGRLNSYHGYVWSLSPEFPGYTHKNADKRVAVRLSSEDDVMDFESFTAAAKHFNVTRGAVRQAYKHGYKFRGWTIEVLDPESLPSQV